MASENRIAAKLVGSLEVWGTEVIGVGKDLLEQAGMLLVEQVARHASDLVRLYVEQHPGLGVPDLMVDEAFQELAIQRFGEEGYTAIFERATGICVAHPDRRLHGQNMTEADDHSPEFRHIYAEGREGKAAGGYYRKTMTNGGVRDKFMFVQPIPDTIYGVAVVTFLSELQAPIRKLRELGLRSMETLTEQVRRDVLEPICALTESTRLVRNGDLSHQVDPGGEDELGELVSAFNQMTGALERSRQEIHDKALDLEMYNDLLTHDIRNAYAAIRGYLEVLRTRCDELPVEQRHQCLNKSMLLIDRSSGLIDRVKTISQIRALDAGSLEPVALGRVVRESVEEVELAYPDRAARLERADGEERYALASPLVKDLVVNLVANGVKHNPAPSPWVRVAVADAPGRPGWLALTVEDDGPGIPDARKEAVFQRFERLGGAKGSGLGLAIVRSLIGKFGGEIEVTDRVAGAPAQGCRMTVRLRAAQAPVAPDGDPE